MSNIGLGNDCVLVDIDGTLADCEHRRHLVEGPIKDWPAFLSPELAALDALFEPVAKVITALAQASYPIIYVSARSNKLRKVTEKWLKQYDLWFEPHLLYLRTDGDTRADTIVKRELLERIRAKGYHPILSFDDRNSVVEMWRDEGITCLQVADGDF
ncbi:NIF family HAD-type phosphatase [soil metagenome]